MDYVDGFVIPVPVSKREQYLKLAQVAAVIFKENGALSVVECWGEDVPEGKITSFPLAVQREQDEAVIFSWIRWPSKAVRDVGVRKTMDDPRLQQMEVPFDGKRMIFGGFEIILDA